MLACTGTAMLHALLVHRCRVPAARLRGGVQLRLRAASGAHSGWMIMHAQEFESNVWSDISIVRAGMQWPCCGMLTSHILAECHLLGFGGAGTSVCAGQAAAAFLQRVLHLGTLPLSRNIHELCLISQSGYNKRQGVPALLRGVCMAAGYMDQLVHLLCLAPGS